MLGLFIGTLRDHVDEHVPLRTKKMSRIPLLPCYNKTVQDSKRHRRDSEQLGTKTRSSVYYEMLNSVKF